MPRNALGRGLSALIREPEQQQSTPQLPTLQPQQQQQVRAVAAAPAAAAAVALAPARSPTEEGLLYIDIDLLDPSPYQPRTRFREESLEELAQSIRNSGIVQPLVARKVGTRFQLIAGERRWRAAQRAGLSKVPVVVRQVAEVLALEMTLVENLQREDLNPIEQAHAFQRLTDEFHLTQEEASVRTGKDRATIANAVRLLRLEDPIQDMIEDGRLTAGHGRALLGMLESRERIALAKRIVRSGMTVRQVERHIARTGRAKPTPQTSVADPNIKEALNELQQFYATKVINQPTVGTRPGHLIFEYYNESDLMRLYDQLMR